MNSRTMLRQKAKKIYKEQTKNVAKKQRIPFAEFFKQYKKNTANTDINIDTNSEQVPEDFDFDSLVNEITDDAVVVEEDIKEKE